MFNASLFYEALPGDIYSGLYLDNCTGYQIEENTFSSNYNPGWAYGYKSVGLVVNNSGPEDNFIYKNNFHNLLFATVAQNHNRSYNTQGTGLQYKCNVFENNYQDISVTWEGQPSELTGIALNQGNKADEITAPAGNLFSQQGTWSYSDFDNQGEFLFYHLPDPTIGFTYSINPIYHTNTTIQRNFNNNLTTWSPLNGCPSRIVSKTINDIEADVLNYDVVLNQYNDTLNSKIDDGNTTSLNLDVATSIPPETMLLRDQLLDASPYLSDTVMVSAAEKEDVLPNSIITEVLSLNPQSAKTDNVLNALNARNYPPNDNEMATILANDTVMGAKELLESKKSFYAGQKQQCVNDLVRIFLQDTSITAVHDSVETTLTNISTPYSYYMQAFARYNRKDSTGVLSKLSEVISDFSLSTYETNIHTDFEDYFNMLLALQSEEKHFYEIDSVKKSALYSIMGSSHDLAQAYARNILILTDGVEYHEPYIFPDTSSTKSSTIVNSELDVDNYFPDLIKIYPNPAKDYLTIEYRLPSVGDGVIEVVALKGAKMDISTVSGLWGEKIIDLRNYPAGVYFIRLWQSGDVLQTKKFVKN
ncbi:MAG: T9SS type A sorting domain-containing protein [Bacteroidales bacterium]|nr:T9SS type A sorting domain-containing protein [Bacteroidales bacterium]